MKKKEIKKLTKKEMIDNIEKLKKDLFNFRFQKVNGQIKSPTKITETKKNIVLVAATCPLAHHLPTQSPLVVLSSVTVAG